MEGKYLKMRIKGIFARFFFRAEKQQETEEAAKDGTAKPALPAQS